MEMASGSGHIHAEGSPLLTVGAVIVCRAPKSAGLGLLLLFRVSDQAFRLSLLLLKNQKIKLIYTRQPGVFRNR
jgi:hypothetical protein